MASSEIRFEADGDDVSVLDGYCMAHGKNRTEIMRFILNDWAGKRLHEAILICRVAGRNPHDSDKGGKP